MGVVVEINPETDLVRPVKEPDLDIVVNGGRMKISRLTKLGKLISGSLGFRSESLHFLLDPSTRLMEDPGSVTRYIAEHNR